ncbi:MAG: HipA domain-containing protein [Lachnospiraceae bacterium]|nr:HipA domain-containing protein [Lachnospiraceae bacterium]
MIDFTDCKINKFKAYGGANGNKINIKYDGTSYMLKFPPIPGRNKVMSYTNSCISEYIACHIYESLGIKTQETILGTYTDKKGKEKVVVACGDFTEDGKKLMEFAQLKNTCIDSEQNGYGTELNTIMQAIEEQALIPPEKLISFFWDMFIVDALLGNFDRHNGNWGILVDEQKQTAEIAPVYDCGSCLYPQLAIEDMKNVLAKEAEIDRRIFVFPTSAVEDNGKKISYFDFISSHKNADCTEALKRIYSRIDMDRLNQIVEETPFVEEIQKEFYKIMIRERKEKILDYAMEQLLKAEQKETPEITMQ